MTAPVRASAAYLLWAHGPAAEDGHAAAVQVVAYARAHAARALTGRGVRVPIPAHLLPEVLTVAELWAPGGDAPPAWTREARAIIEAGRP